MKKYGVVTGWGENWDNFYNQYNAHPSNEDNELFSTLEEAKKRYDELVEDAKGEEGQIVELYEVDEEQEYNYLSTFETSPEGWEIIPACGKMQNLLLGGKLENVIEALETKYTNKKITVTLHLNDTKIFLDVPFETFKKYCCYELLIQEVEEVKEFELSEEIEIDVYMEI